MYMISLPSLPSVIESLINEYTSDPLQWVRNEYDVLVSRGTCDMHRNNSFGIFIYLMRRNKPHYVCLSSSKREFYDYIWNQFIQ